MLSKYSFLYIVYYVYSIIIILLTLCIMRWMSNLGSDADQYICQHFQLNNLAAHKCNVDHFGENILTERESINHLKKEFHKIISYLTISLSIFSLSIWWLGHCFFTWVLFSTQILEFLLKNCRLCDEFATNLVSFSNYQKPYSIPILLVHCAMWF